MDNAFINEFFEKIAPVCRRDVSDLSLDTRFKEDLRAKSQVVFAVAAILERMTGIKISYADVKQFATLGEVLEFVDTLQKNK